MHLVQIKNAIIYLFSLDISYRYLLYKVLPISLFRYPSEVANRMVCITWLSWCLFLSYRNLIMEPWASINSPWTVYMENQMISYFLYDLVILSSTARGRKQFIFFIHHFISLLVPIINRYQPLGDNFINNSVIAILELASPFLNLSKIVTEFAPHHYFTRYLNSFTRILYLFSRIVCFGPWIIYYIHTYYHFELKYNITVTIELILFLGSIQWFRMM
jgi:hypothetical protein